LEIIRTMLFSIRLSLLLLGVFVFAAAQSPNVVLILADDQGWVGTSEQMDPSVPDSRSDFYRTPAIERLAREGMRFTNAYAPHPNCSPTRLAIQTGKSPAQLRMTDIINRNSGPFYEGLPMIPPEHINNLPSEEITLAEMIKAGNPDYVTGHFGKWHLGGGGPGRHGYDQHDGATTNAEGRMDDPNPKRILGVTRRANDFMERQVKRGRPFFIQVSHYAVHLGIFSLKKTEAEYEARQKGERHNHPGHAAMTENLDTGVGMLLDKIDELGIAGNTLVIYTSDNGSYTHAGATQVTTNLPLHGQKASLWEGGIRVPLIARGPGVKVSAVCDVPVIGTDLYPTILRLLRIGTPLPKGIEGGNLTDLFRTGQGSVVRGRKELVWHFPHYQIQKGTTPQSAIRHEEWKLIRYYETGELKLFNLARDLGEEDDLAKRHPDRVKDLEARLDAYLKSIDAPMAKRAPKPETSIGRTP
jgi:arylsulfatase A